MRGGWRKGGEGVKGMGNDREGGKELGRQMGGETYGLGETNEMW